MQTPWIPVLPAFIHSKSIVHKDIKPANIMVMADGTIKPSHPEKKNMLINPHFIYFICDPIAETLYYLSLDHLSERRFFRRPCATPPPHYQNPAWFFFIQPATFTPAKGPIPPNSMSFSVEGSGLGASRFGNSVDICESHIALRKLAQVFIVFPPVQG